MPLFTRVFGLLCDLLAEDDGTCPTVSFYEVDSAVFRDVTYTVPYSEWTLNQSSIVEDRSPSRPLLDAFLGLSTLNAKLKVVSVAIGKVTKCSHGAFALMKRGLGTLRYYRIFGVHVVCFECRMKGNSSESVSPLVVITWASFHVDIVQLALSRSTDTYAASKERNECTCRRFVYE